MTLDALERRVDDVLRDGCLEAALLVTVRAGHARTMSRGAGRSNWGRPGAARPLHPPWRFPERMEARQAHGRAGFLRPMDFSGARLGRPFFAGAGLAAVFLRPMDFWEPALAAAFFARSGGSGLGGRRPGRRRWEAWPAHPGVGASMCPGPPDLGALDGLLHPTRGRLDAAPPPACPSPPPRCAGSRGPPSPWPAWRGPSPPPAAAAPPSLRSSPVRLSSSPVRLRKSINCLSHFSAIGLSPSLGVRAAWRAARRL